MTRASRGQGPRSMSPLSSSCLYWLGLQAIYSGLVAEIAFTNYQAARLLKLATTKRDLHPVKIARLEIATSIFGQPKVIENSTTYRPVTTCQPCGTEYLSSRIYVVGCWHEHSGGPGRPLGTRDLHLSGHSYGWSCAGRTCQSLLTNMLRAVPSRCLLAGASGTRMF